VTRSGSAGRTVLVVEDGSGGTALAAVRALGAAGRRVVLASSTGSYAARSRSCAAALTVRPAQDPAGHVADVAAACRAHAVDVVLPCGDAELLALSAARELPGAPRLPLALPPHDAVLRAFDKRALAAAAQQVGLGVPAAPAGRLPVVVKPATRHGDRGRGPAPTVLAHTAGQAAAAAQALAARGLVAVQQQQVEGTLIALVVLLGRDGRVLARLQQSADRVYPLGAGNLVRGRTVAVQEDLAARVVALLRALGWYGLAQVELVRPAGGEPIVLDLNGRPYGSLGLALAAGVDLPDRWLRDALDLPATPYAEARTGVTYQAREQDLRRALAARSPSLAADVLDTLRVRPDAGQVWAPHDRGPLLAFAGQLARRAAARLPRPSLPLPSLQAA